MKEDCVPYDDSYTPENKCTQTYDNGTTLVSDAKEYSCKKMFSLSQNTDDNDWRSKNQEKITKTNLKKMLIQKRIVNYEKYINSNKANIIIPIPDDFGGGDATFNCSWFQHQDENEDKMFFCYDTTQCENYLNETHDQIVDALQVTVEKAFL